MDRQARKLQTQREDQALGEEPHEPSDEEEKEVSFSYGFLIRSKISTTSQHG
jgi:hypothetical protein